MGDSELTTAWFFGSQGTGDRVIPLPPDVHLFSNANTSWTGFKWGLLSDGENWPWDWTRDQFQRTIDGYLQDRELLADIELCWPELAWDFAHQMSGRDPTVQSEAVQRVDLEAAISKYRALTGANEVHIGGPGGGWRLTEGEAFVADLARLDVSEVGSPWATCEHSGHHDRVVVDNRATSRTSSASDEDRLRCLPSHRRQASPRDGPRIAHLPTSPRIDCRLSDASRPRQRLRRRTPVQMAHRTSTDRFAERSTMACLQYR